jgi:hypothetical protein
MKNMQKHHIILDGEPAQTWLSKKPTHIEPKFALFNYQQSVDALSAVENSDTIIQGLKKAVVFRLPTVDFRNLTRDDAEMNEAHQIAQDMQRFNLLHLPFQSIFIQYGHGHVTAFAQNSNQLVDQTHQGLLVVDRSDHWFMQRFTWQTMGSDTSLWRCADQVEQHELMIEDNFQLKGRWIPGKSTRDICNNIGVLNRHTVFSLVALLVTKGTEVEAVPQIPKGLTAPRGVHTKRQWEKKFPVVHFIRVSNKPSNGVGNGGAGTKKRMHLRRGHVWGRFSRPVEEQRWVPPTLVNASDDENLSEPVYILH